MADSVREQKLAAARKKLRQFQKKKGTKRAVEYSSKETTPDIEGSIAEGSNPQSESGTLSSRASSVDLVSEEFTDQPAAIDHGETHSDVLPSSQGVLSGIETVSTQSARPEKHGEQRGVHLNYADSVHSLLPQTEGSEKITSSTYNYTNENPALTSEGHDYSQTVSVNGTGDNTGLNTEVPSYVPQQTANETESFNQQNKLASYFQSTPDYNSTPRPDPFSLSLSTTEVISPDESDVGTKSYVESENLGPQLSREQEPTSAFQTVIPSSQPHTVDDHKEPTVIGTEQVYQGEQISPESFEREGSVSSETTASVTTAIHVTKGESQDEPVLKSSSESLRQISLQLSGLMSESEGAASDTSNNTVLELERRNSELAALLQQESQTSQQQSQYIGEMKAHVERLEAELNAARGILNSSVTGGAREVESLREQLQVHIQTIGILVSEKSELQTSLTHANHALKLKAGEVTELDGRLSASRQRVGELEASVKDLNVQRDALKSSQDGLSKDLDASKMTNFKSNKLCEELKTSIAELTERLSVKTSDHEKLMAQLTETKSQLAMAQLNLQQLRDGTSDDLQTQLENVQAAHMESQRQLQECQAELGKAHTEHSHVAAQYQQYTTQLASQMEALQKQVHQLSTEKEAAVIALEETQAKLKGAQEPDPSPRYSEEEVKAEKERYEQIVATLEEEKNQMQHQITAMTNDNSQLSKLVDQLSNKVEEMELKVERTKTEEVNTSQLLAAMQSDKVAAARALTQNKQLKEQLEELQSGFIIMSNKKLELTEKLEKELHVKKSLNQEIASLNEQIANMRQQTVEKDREIVQLKENSESLGNQLMLTREQMNKSGTGQAAEDIKDLNEEIMRLRNQLAAQEEKQRISQSRIEELEKENSDLCALLKETKTKDTSEIQKEVHLTNGNVSEENNSEDDETGSSLLGKVASLTEKIRQLETESGNLRSQLETEKSKYNQLLKASEEKQMASESNGKSLGTETTVDPVEFQTLKKAHEALETRFGRSMDQVAELSDEKQKLEHIIQQLQIETEAIGDYITIYQFQRGVMKQQARERELELSSLRHEREEMKIKLSTLQELMSTLVQEKGPNHPNVVKMEKVINESQSDAKNIEKNEENVNGDIKTKGIEAAEEATEVEKQNETCKETSTTNSGLEKTPSPNKSMKDQNLSAEKKSPTVQRILDLLNEMEATSQVEHCGLQKFHPCPLCSGKLITV
ncbi:golgin subfamily A member 2-like [Penaeus monodon]|uniref:golgin subfamily A member 2-like n=1 Tax=Penaeus monodon TaxID=6687 RepID=UPI0018A77819|nr:golgin subfamily A member 2-like [Penaeus monodon]